MRALIQGIAIAVVALTFAQSAHAGGPTTPGEIENPKDPQAAQLKKDGDYQYNVEANYAKAIDLYKQGARIEDAGIFAYDIGQCYRLLGSYKDAIWHYRRFLAHAKPEGKLKEVVEGFIANMQAELDKAASTQAPQGPASGDDRNDRGGAGTTGPPTTPHTNDGGATPLVGALSQPAAPWYDDRVGWAILGGGVALAAVGTGFEWDASNLYDDANDPTHSETLRTQEKSRADDRRLAGFVVAGVGVAAIVVGVIKLASNPPARLDTMPPRTARNVGLSVGPGGICLTGRF